jgi:hypothetical protein
MAQPAGTQYLIWRPRIFIAALGTKLPGIDIPEGGDWNTDITPGPGVTEWHRIPHTDEGATITPSAPKDDIVSDEAGGAIGVVPSGESEITISFTPITYNLDLFTYLSSLQVSQDVAESVVPGSEAPAYQRLSLTPEGRQFMFGIEGSFQEGTLTDEGGFVRAFGYRVEQTNDVDINMRRTSDDAVLRLEAEVRCLVTTVSSAQLADTGITETDERFDLFVVPNAA